MIIAMHTMTVITNYDGCKKLERLLTLWDEVAHQEKGKFFRTTIDFKTQSTTMVIPRGFPLGWLKSELRNHTYKTAGLTYKPATIDINSTFEPRDRQQEEALGFLADNAYLGRLTLNLRTDEGKTYVALKHICDNKTRAMIIVHNTLVMEQWLLRIQTLTDIKLEEIGILKGRESIDKKKIDGKKIFIAIHRTLESVIENDPRRLDKFCKDHGIGIKVYDEAHFELKSIFTIDSFTDVPFTMYLTATASRTDWKEDRLFKYIIPINELERFGGGAEKVHKSHRYHKFKFISYRTNTLFSEQAALQGRRGFDLNRWATNTLRDNRKEVFTTAVIDEIKRIDAMTQPEGTTEWPPRHCIVLKSLEQCKEFKLALSEYGDENVGMFSGITKDQKERYQELTKHIIIATEKSIGTAIDSDIDVLHCTVPMSSKSWFYQMVGRLRQHRMALFIGYVDVSIEACEVIGRIQKKLAKKISVSIDEDVATTVITPVTFAEEEKEHVDVSLPKKKPQKKKKIVVPDESEDIAAEVSEPEEEISTVIPRPMISRTKGTPKKPIRLLPKGK